MKKISVIVPFFNCRQHIAHCIESLLAQTYPRALYEIILVDNNSTDGSAAVAANYTEIKILKESKQGSYAARNSGIRAACGEILAFTDPDCVVAPNWLEAISEGLTRGYSNVLMGYRHYADDSLLMTLLAAYEAEKAAFVLNSSIRELYYGYTNNMAVRRDVVEQIGLFPERTRGGDTVFVQTVVAHYGCEVVRFSREMRIRHLEVVNISDYYEKRLVYGQSNERIHQAFAYRSLSNAERWCVLLQTLSQHRFSTVQSAVLLCLLIPGAIYYEFGRWRALRRATSVQPDSARKAGARVQETRAPVAPIEISPSDAYSAEAIPFPHVLD